MRHSLRTLSAALLAVSMLFPAVADAGMTIEGKPKASFLATGSPGFMSIEGITSTVKLVDDGTRLTFSVPMSTVSSGIALRDEHMNKNYVQIDKYPDAKLDLAKADVTWPASGKASGTVTGNFTIHGVTQPISISYDITKSKTGYDVKAKFDYDVSKHGITIEPYMGISFDHKMNANVTVSLVDAP